MHNGTSELKGKSVAAKHNQKSGVSAIKTMLLSSCVQHTGDVNNHGLCLFRVAGQNMSKHCLI